MISTSGLHMDQAPPLSIPLRFFATAPLFMALFGVALLYWQGDLFFTPLMPESVTTTHLATLGWIGMVMFGAMYQMIPVLAGLPVPWIGSATWSHLLLIIGLLALFGEIGIGADFGIIPFAGAALGGGVLTFIIPIGHALYHAPAKHPTVWAMRLATGALTLTMLLGLVFLWEYQRGFLDLDRYALLGVHLLLGLVGWIGLLIIGVSFQVLPMFYMTPPFPTRPAAWILGGLTFSLLLLCATLLLVGTSTGLLLGASVPGIAALILYGLTMGKTVAQRKRKHADSTFRFWQFGFACGILSLITLASWPLLDDDRLRFQFATLFLLGWATSIILGMLYKIIPFLVWFHRFSRLAGLVPIPMMDDLIPEQATKWHLPLHSLVIIALLSAFWSGWNGFIILAGVFQIFSALLLANAIWFALRQKPPEVPAMPDFNSFFKDMKLPGPT